jgi:sulfate transport system substrate-binding protein
MKTCWRSLTSYGAILLLALVVIACQSCRKKKDTTSEESTITLYGFSILKEPLEKDIFPAFQNQMLQSTGRKINFVSSFAGSELITNQILSGVHADVAIVAIERDAERLRHGGATKTDWHQYPHNGIVNHTPFVILVRKGNPKGIRDFEDLARPGIKLIHPDPVMSGGAQWSLLAVYGAALLKSEKVSGHRDENKARGLLKNIWKNVIATPGSAREARTQFELGFSDAIITYEMEALQLKERQAPIEIITPECTIFSEHPVVILDQKMSPTKRVLVDSFMRFLWSETAQKYWIKYHLRAITDEQLNEAEPLFVSIALPFRITEFGGWQRAFPEIIEPLWKQLQKKN